MERQWEREWDLPSSGSVFMWLQHDLSWSLESKASFVSSRWVVGDQALGSSSADFPKLGRLVRSRAAGTWANIPTGCQRDKQWLYPLLTTPVPYKKRFCFYWILCYGWGAITCCLLGYALAGSWIESRGGRSRTGHSTMGVPSGILATVQTFTLRLCFYQETF